MSDREFNCLHELVVREEQSGYYGSPEVALYCDLKESHVARGEPHSCTVTPMDQAPPDWKPTKRTYRVTWEIAKEASDA